MSRPLIIATIVGASVGASYLNSKSSNGKNSAGTAPPAANFASTQSGSSAGRLPVIGGQPPAAPNLAGGKAAVSAMPMGGSQFTSADQVLRFDVTKEWVYRNWDRKSTGATDVGLFSVRVPLVMTSHAGLAGALTYYFNTQGQVEHISFRGRTADSTQLVQLMTRNYGLARVESPTGEQVYQLQSSGQVYSELRTHPEPILYAKTPNQSIAVELELARPGSSRVLPPRPTGFEVPQVAGAPAAQSPPVASHASKGQSGAAAASGNSYLNKIRYATPSEESQVLFKRWPIK